MKKIVTVVLVALICVAFAGCSASKNDTATKDSAPGGSETTTQETVAAQVETAAVMYDTVEDYINTPDVKKSIDSAKDASSDVMTFDYHAEGNQLIYDYTYNDQISDSDLDGIRTNLENSLESNADKYTEVVKVLKKNVKINDPQIVLNYHNADGSVIATRTYG